MKSKQTQSSESGLNVDCVLPSVSRTQNHSSFWLGACRPPLSNHMETRSKIWFDLRTDCGNSHILVQIFMLGIWSLMAKGPPTLSECFKLFLKPGTQIKPQHSQEMQQVGRQFFSSLLILHLHVRTFRVLRSCRNTEINRMLLGTGAPSYPQI